MISDNSNSLRVFLNNNNGTLQNLGSITITGDEHHIYKFKVRQLNDKTKGYVQYIPDDRSDIIFIDHDLGDEEVPDRICAYLNNYPNDFEELENFTADYDYVKCMEVADVDGDGFNDIIIICTDGS